MFHTNLTFNNKNKEAVSNCITVLLTFSIYPFSSAFWFSISYEGDWIDFPPFFQKGNIFCEVLYTFLQVKPLLQWGVLWEERIYSKGSRFFPFGVDLSSKGRQSDQRVVSFQNLLVPFKLRLALVAQLDASRTGDKEVAGLIPAVSDNILSWRLIMKYFLLSFPPFRRFKKCSCQFLAKECAQVLVNSLDG